MATELGISGRQFRRERADICKRIATYIRERQLPEWAPRLEMFDALRFQFERADAQAEIGEFESAMRTYDNILRASTRTPEKVESLCKRAEVELECGRFTAVRTSLSHATTLFVTDERGFTGKSLAASRANVALLESKLAWATADFTTANVALDSAKRTIECVRSIAGKRIKELFLDILIESATRACSQGDFAGSLSALAEIETIGKTMPEISLPLQIDWTMRRIAHAILAARPGTGFGIGEYALQLQRALDLARTCKSLKRIVEVEGNLANACFGLAGGTMLETARRIVSTARELKNWTLLTTVSIAMADYLLASDRWREAPAFLQDAEQNSVDGTHSWVATMTIKSIYCLKAGALLEGLRCGHEAYRGAKAMGSPRMIASVLRCLASIVFALGRRTEAAEYIEDAVPIAERSASAFACWNTYCIAGEITGDAKYGKAAAELRRALMAR